MSDADIATLGINVDSRQVRTAETDLRGLERQGARTEQATTSLGTAFRGLSGIIAAVGVGSLMRDLVRTAEQIQNVNIRIQGLTKSAQDYANVTAYISATSDRMHKSNLQMSESFSKLLVLEQNSLITRKQSMAILEGMANVQSKTGASAEQLSQAMYGFSQSMAAGVVNMEDFNQVTEPLPGLLNEMAKASGVSVGQLRELVKQGQITSDIFGKILTSSLESYQGAAEAAGQTLTATYADVANAWQDLVAIIESPISDVISPVLHAIGGAVQGLAQDFRELKAFKDEVLKSMSGSAFLSGINAGNSLVMPSARLGEGAKPKSEGEAYMAAKEAEAAKKATEGETAALKAKIQELLKEAGAHKEVSAARRSAASSAARGMSEEQKAAKELADTYDREMKALQDQNARLSQSARDYEKTKLAAKGLTDEMIVQAMRIYDANQRLEEKNKLTQAEKSEMDGLIEQYNKLTLSAREYYKTIELPSKGIIGEAQKPYLAQYDKNAQTKEKQDTLKANRVALEAYVNQLDKANTSLQSFAATSNDVFSASLGGINQMISAFNDMAESIKQNGEAFVQLSKDKNMIDAMKPKEGDKDAAKNMELYNKARIKYEKDFSSLQQKNLSDNLDGIRIIAGTSAQMFEEGTAGAKALHAVEMASGIARLAQEISLMQVKGANAVLTQGEGDPYSAFARIASMIGIVAGIIGAAGGTFASSGKGSSAPAANPSAGTVLGDKSKVSESTTNIAELLKSIHADEYAELRGINSGVKQLNGGITDTITKLFQGGGLPDFNSGALKSSGSGLWNTIGGFLFGKTNTTEIGNGIGIGSQKIGDLIAGKMVDAAQFSFTSTTKTGFLGGLFGGKKTTYSSARNELSSDVKGGLTDIFVGISKTMVEAAKGLGANIEGAINNYVIPKIWVDLKGLNAEESVKKLNGVISSTLDKMASDVFGKIIGKYQQLGEGMMETAVRLVSEVAVVKDALSVSGLKMTTNMIGLSDAIVQAAGGIEEFQKQFSVFFDNFYTDGEKFRRLASQFKSQLSDLFGDKVVKAAMTSRDVYRQLVESLDVTWGSQKDKYSLLIKLAEAANSYFDTLESRQDKSEQKLKDKLSKAEDNLRTAYNSQISTIQQVIEKFAAFKETLTKFRESLILGSSSTINTQSKYDIARAKLAKTNATISAGYGSTPESQNAFAQAIGDLQGNVQDFLEASKANAKSGFEYDRDFRKALVSLSSGIKGSDSVKTVQDEQLDMLKVQVEKLINIDDSVLSVKDAIKGVEAATIQLNKAQAKRDKAQEAAASAVKKSQADRISAQQAAAANPPKPSGTPQAQGGTEPYAWISTWQYIIAMMRTGGIDMATFNRYFSAEGDQQKADIYKLMNGGTVKGFARGGKHPGGWRIVGENGPELENTMPSRIYSNSDSKGLLNNKELLDEIKKLREESKAQALALATSNEIIAKIVKRWDGDGMPEVRTTIA